MSNAKWRKLFSAMHSNPRPLGGVGIKFINDDRCFKNQIPGPDFRYEDNTGECGGISYQPFAHIEFVEIPNSYFVSRYGPRYPDTEIHNDLDSFVVNLLRIGLFPIRKFDDCIRILGYEWDSESDSTEGAERSAALGTVHNGTNRPEGPEGAEQSQPTQSISHWNALRFANDHHFAKPMTATEDVAVRFRTIEIGGISPHRQTVRAVDPGLRLARLRLAALTRG